MVSQPVPDIIITAFWVTAVLIPWVVGIAFLYHVITDPARQVRRVKSEYEALLKSKDETIKELKERLAFLQRRHKEEMKQYTRISRMLHELKKAMDAGVIGLVHVKDGGEVELLADGTMICRKERKRVWPVEEGGEGDEG